MITLYSVKHIQAYSYMPAPIKRNVGYYQACSEKQAQNLAKTSPNTIYKSYINRV